jgi:NAD(P)-dependent dehydrogenase (short-subunit alcohol dehydrogenase family)
MTDDMDDVPRSGTTRLLAAAATVATGFLALRALARRARTIELAGRVALVTGGSRGLGLVIARELAARGVRLAICSRDRDELDRAVQSLRARGADVRAIACDVGEENEVARMIETVEQEFGRLDLLINNAGVIQVGPPELMTHDDYERAMRVHFWGPLHTIQAALPVMRRNGGGRIVNISSIGGKISLAHLLPYAASKFALSGLSQAMRATLAHENIYVTTVYPGLMRTGSPRNAEVRGRHEAEYAWFSIADALPGLTMSATRAAHKIVEACRRGDAELIMPVHYKAAAIAHTVFPELSADLLALMERALPSSSGNGNELRKGWQSTSKLSPSVLTRLGDRAARRNNEM